MDRTAKVINALIEWQNEEYENVDSGSDILVFNAVGIIIALVNGKLMDISNTFDFIGLLSLNEEEKEKVALAVANAYDKANKEEDVNEEENN